MSNAHEQEVDPDLVLDANATRALRIRVKRVGSCRVCEAKHIRRMSLVLQI